MSVVDPANFKTRSCVLCRQRKLRCDGGEPCRTCSRARQLVICTYPPKTDGQLKTDLRKGGACLSCRQIKRKCDGKLPCMTCKANERPQECRYQYRPRTGRRKPGANTCSDGLSADGASTSSWATGPSQLYSAASTGGDIDVRSFLERTATGLLPGVDSLPQHPEFSTAPFENKGASPFLSSSFSDPRCTGFSLDSARVLELFELRNLFLDHCWQYGLNVTAEQRDALSRGDTSGKVVHPVLVNVCQLLGYQLANRFPSDPLHFRPGQTAGREVEQAMSIFDVLQGGVKVLDPTTSIQIYNLLGGYYAVEADLPMFTQLLERLSALVLHNRSILGLDDGLVLDPASQVDPTSCYPQGFAQEARSAFSAMIFLQLTAILVLKSPLIIDSSLLTTFRRLGAIHRRDTEMNFMRARSVCFLYDTKRLVAELIEIKHGTPSEPLPSITVLNSVGFGDPARGDWSKRYCALIDDIHAHLNVVNNPLIEVSFTHAAQVFTLKTCVIIALASLADLYALFAPYKPESLRKRDAAVEEIASITSMFIGSDFHYLDTTLGMCWAVALRPIVGDVGCPNWADLVGHPLPKGGPSPTSLDKIRDCFQSLRLSSPSSKPSY
ncbi:hypothetical protein DFH06DRAFT_109659 [Mycena polygramma]|nr:hypothetical protein DFH06DRAFT_109659 [Mycena polygramma]